MSQYLPYSRFKWLNQKEIDRFDVNSVSEKDSHGYILNIDQHGTKVVGVKLVPNLGNKGKYVLY